MLNIEHHFEAKDKSGSRTETGDDWAVALDNPPKVAIAQEETKANLAADDLKGGYWDLSGWEKDEWVSHHNAKGFCLWIRRTDSDDPARIWAEDAIKWVNLAIEKHKQTVNGVEVVAAGGKATCLDVPTGEIKAKVEWEINNEDIHNKKLQELLAKHPQQN